MRNFATYHLIRYQGPYLVDNRLEGFSRLKCIESHLASHIKQLTSALQAKPAMLARKLPLDPVCRLISVVAAATEVTHRFVCLPTLAGIAALLRTFVLEKCYKSELIFCKGRTKFWVKQPRHHYEFCN